MNYYKRFPGDYLRKTLDLAMIEDGAYTRLLDWLYANERPIPKGDRYRIARAQNKAERDAVDSVVARFFYFADTGYSQVRAKELIVRRQKAHEAHVDAGRKGGRTANQTETKLDTDLDTDLDANLDIKTEPNAKAHPLSHKATKLSKSKVNTKSLAAAPPGWVDAELWQQWREARQAMQARMTPHGETLLIRKLDLLRAAGNDPRAVIEQSIERNWKGFFELRDKRGHQGSQFESRISEQERVIGALTGDRKGRTIEPTD